jgi:hypothetical protein
MCTSSAPVTAPEREFALSIHELRNQLSVLSCAAYVLRRRTERWQTLPVDLLAELCSAVEQSAAESAALLAELSQHLRSSSCCGTTLPAASIRLAVHVGSNGVAREQPAAERLQFLADDALEPRRSSAAEMCDSETIRRDHVLQLRSHI